MQHMMLSTWWGSKNSPARSAIDVWPPMTYLYPCRVGTGIEWEARVARSHARVGKCKITSGRGPRAPTKRHMANRTRRAPE